MGWEMNREARLWDLGNKRPVGPSSLTGVGSGLTGCAGRSGKAEGWMHAISHSSPALLGLGEEEDRCWLGAKGPGRKFCFSGREVTVHLYAGCCLEEGEEKKDSGRDS